MSMMAEKWKKNWLKYIPTKEEQIIRQIKALIAYHKAELNYLRQILEELKKQNEHA